MVITTKIDRQDLAQRGPVSVISAVQDDQYSRNIEIPLYVNGESFVIPDGTKAIVTFKKQDGTGGNYDTLPDWTSAYSFVNNTVTIALAPQVLTAPGRVDLSVGLINDKSKIYTFLIYIDVQPNPGLQATSDNYFKVIGALSSHGWEPNRYLGTDAGGNVVTKLDPEGGSVGGVTVEEVLAAVPTANAAKIAKAEDGTITITTPMTNGSTSVCVLTPGSDGWPVKATIDGNAVPITWEGW